MCALILSLQHLSETYLVLKIIQRGVIINVQRYVGGPKNNRNLNVARELEVDARCAARCRESTQ